MSLRRALATLPDDRDSVTAARDVIAYLDRHRGEPLEPSSICRATGVPQPRLEAVLEALKRGLVIDCDGDALDETCRFVPDTMLDIEVRRFLKSSENADAVLRRRVDRFRGRYGARR